MKIYEKLLEAKKEIGKATKSSTNPHFKSKYVDINALIETVETVLLSKGLVLLQPIENGKVYTRIVDAESEQMIESFIELPTTGTPQAMGSAITYFRRYTLQSLLSMQAQDDDGNLASQPQPKVKQVMGDKAFTQFCERLINGEVELITKVRESFQLTPSQESEVSEILKK